MKSIPSRIRLDGDVEAEVKTISDATGLSQVEVIRQLVKAGAAAIKANGYKLALPLQLHVADSEKRKAHPELPSSVQAIGQIAAKAVAAGSKKGAPQK